jgi:beta-lactamase class A
MAKNGRAMSLYVPSQRRGIRSAVAVVAAMASLAGCSGNPLSTSQISSTPVATPIVVSNTPAASGSPLTEGGTPPPPPSPVDAQAIEQRRKVISDLIAGAREKYPGHSAVIFADLDNDTRVEFEPEARFESASLCKLLILAELYRQFQVGNHAPEESLVLLESQKMGGSGQLRHAKEGTQHSLQSLAEAMITESDNTATQMLTDLLTLEQIQEGTRALGLGDTTLQRDIFDFAAIDQGRDNYITARDAAAFLQQLAREELPGSRQMSEILERQKRNDMIGKEFPTGVRVAHKTGELDGILHDAAIVYAPRGNFILVCLSDQVVDKEVAKQVWAGLSLDILKLYFDPTPTPSPQKISATP